jgi:hypothetical protein
MKRTQINASADAQRARLDDIILDKSYDERQVGEIVRLYLLASANFGVEGYEQGYAEGSEDGYAEGYSEGEEDGLHRGRIGRVYIGVFVDESVPGDLGTSIRILSASSTAQGARRRALAKLDKKVGESTAAQDEAPLSKGAVFVLNFDLHYEEPTA